MRQLAIVTNDCKKLLDECGLADVEVLSIADYSLESFVKKEMQLYRHCKRLILQRSLIEEDDAAFAYALEQLKLLYVGIKAIIIYPGCENIDFLRAVMQLEIYDVVTESDLREQKSRLDECLLYGTDAQYWIRKFPELEESDNEEKKSKKFMAISLKRKIIIAAALLAVILAAIIFVFTSISKSKENTVTVKSDESITTTTATTKTKTDSSAHKTDATKSTTEKSVTETTVTSKAATTIKSTTATKSTTTETTTASKSASVTKSAQTKQTTSQTKRQSVQTTTVQTTAATTVKETSSTAKATTTATTLSIKLTGLRLSESTVNLTVGSSTRLTAIFTPNAATNKNVTWSSNRTDRIVVDSNGTCTAVGVGAAIITCTSADGGLTASCMVTGVE